MRYMLTVKCNTNDKVESISWMRPSSLFSLPLLDKTEFSCLDVSKIDKVFPQVQVLNILGFLRIQRYV